MVTREQIEKIVEEHGLDVLVTIINVMLWVQGGQKSTCPALPYGSTACIIARAYGFSECDCLGK